LSYLGDIERTLPQGGPRDEHGRQVYGDLTLLTPFGFTPRQDLTRITVSAHYYRGDLILCANADATYFDRAQTMDFIALFKSLLGAEVGADKVASEAARTRTAEVLAHE